MRLMKDIFVYFGGSQWIPKDVERVKINPSVKVIEKKAFADCQKLKYVQFCNGVEQIDDDAFRGCISLKSVRMAPTTRYIANSAFRSCTKLCYVILNEGLYMIGRQAFDQCESMEFLEIPSTTSYIHSRAFRNCRALKEVLLNEELLYVGTNAFELCTNLKAVTVPPNVDTKFGRGAKKWIRQWPVKDEHFWNYVASSANLADMANMAKCGMLSPTDINHAQKVIEELECRHTAAKKYEQGLMASLESWKKISFDLQAQRNSRQIVVSNKQVHSMEVEDDISHGVQAMAIDSAGKKGRPAARAAQVQAMVRYSSNTSNVRIQTCKSIEAMVLLSNKDRPIMRISHRNCVLLLGTIKTCCQLLVIEQNGWSTWTNI